jgi:hypothetical protein
MNSSSHKQSSASSLGRASSPSLPLLHSRRRLRETTPPSSTVKCPTESYTATPATLLRRTAAILPQGMLSRPLPKEEQHAKCYTWDTTFYIIGMNYDLIGYPPGDFNLENTWFSMASQLSYTVDNHTRNNVPGLKYVTQHYSGKSRAFTWSSGTRMIVASTRTTGSSCLTVLKFQRTEL